MIKKIINPQKIRKLSKIYNNNNNKILKSNNKFNNIINPKSFCSLLLL